MAAEKTTAEALQEQEQSGSEDHATTSAQTAAQDVAGDGAVAQEDSAADHSAEGHSSQDHNSIGQPESDPAQAHDADEHSDADKHSAENHVGDDHDHEEGGHAHADGDHSHADGDHEHADGDHEHAEGWTVDQGMEYYLAPSHLFEHVQDADYFELPRFVGLSFEKDGHSHSGIKLPNPLGVTTEKPLLKLSNDTPFLLGKPTKFMVLELVGALVFVCRLYSAGPANCWWPEARRPLVACVGSHGGICP